MTEKFLGCIISIKTKVNQLTGGVQNIIGNFLSMETVIFLYGNS